MGSHGARKGLGGRGAEVRRDRGLGGREEDCGIEAWGGSHGEAGEWGGPQGPTGDSSEGSRGHSL